MRISNEIRVGIMFVVGLSLLVLLIVTMTRVGQDHNAYAFSIRFDQAAGIQNGADVRVSGVKVGQVAEIGLDPKTNQALVTVHVDRRVMLLTGYQYTIGIGGLVGEKFIDIRPTSAGGQRVTAGQTIDGTTSADINDLIQHANDVVQKLSTTADSFNAIVGDKDSQRNFKVAVANLRKTSEASAQFTEALNVLARRNAASVDAIVADLRGVSGDLRRVSDELTPQLKNSKFFANLDQASQNAVAITERLNRIAASAETMFNDKTLSVSLGDALANLKQASVDLTKVMASARQAAEPLPQIAANLQKATADLPTITQPFKTIAPETADNVLAISRSLRKTSESIGGVAERVTKLGGTLSSISIEPDARLLFLTSGDSRARSDFNIDFRGDARMFRAGLADIGKTSKLNAQFGNKLGNNFWFRYGIVQSNFGLGADYRLGPNWRFTGEILDPNQLRANLLADYRMQNLGPGWWMTAGWYDLFDTPKLGVGLSYRP